MQIHKISLFGQFVTLLLLFGMAFNTYAASTRAFDRIEVNTGAEENIITVRFNIPVRYISHVMNEANNEVGIQLQILQTLERDIADLVQTDQLSWKPSAEIPLDKVVFQGQAMGPSSLLVSFVSPVQGFEIRQGKDFSRMDFILKNPGKSMPAKP